jgi:hypothetical protein
MKAITVVGIVIALTAMIAMASPAFTTAQTKDIAKIGDVKLQSTEESTHVIPMALSVSLLAFGLVLVGAGVYTKQTA